jgi:hypothetical protein
METFADTSAFNAGVKEKNTKTNKITIVKNQKLATIPYLHQRPIFFKANSIHSSVVAILELIRGAQCLIEVIRSSGEEMLPVDAYQIPHYSRGIEIIESEIILIPPSLKISESSSNGSYRNTDEV